MVGKSLSHYRILDELGRGGMGIVYKAQDTKLDRVVAIKVLPASALSSEDDRARFYREAKSAAQLHHPHIAAVFEIDEAAVSDNPTEELRPFIAMEFVDGEPLQDLVKAGPMKLEKAVRIATQIAQALEAAHEKNIVHRDIKAGNVMMTSKGDAKVLDFGLAKTTHSTMLTKMGSTVGTAAYMSPEQTRGDAVDHRSDLWSLGVLLYEMIAGKIPFGGDYEQAITYSILNEEPEPLTAVRTGVPMGLEWIVSKLLTKNAADRYQSAKGLIVDLRTVDLNTGGMSRVSTTRTSMTTAASDAPSRPPRDFSRILWAVAGGLFVTIAALLWPRSSTVDPGPITPKQIVQSLSIPLGLSTIDISPQGDKVAFGGSAIHLLDLGTGDVRTYGGTGTFVHLDFSASGDQLLLTTAAGIERMSLATGSMVNVVSTREGGPRAEWRNDEYVVYEESQTIYGISTTSSESRQIVVRDTLSGEYDLDFPHVLPDGKTVVATAEFRDAPSRIGFWDIESGRNLGYLNYPGYRVQWMSPGYLVFAMEGDAMALPFNPDKLSQTGPIIPIEQAVRPQGLSISREGTLAWIDTGIGVSSLSRLVVPVAHRVVGSSGNVVLAPDRFPAAVYVNGAVSPDGKSLAVAIHEYDDTSEEPISDIWILDFTTGSRRALTQGGTSDYPAWSAAGDSIYFVNNGVNDEIMVMAASGRGSARKVMPVSTFPTLADLTVSSDGVWAGAASGFTLHIDAQSRIRLWNLRSTDSDFRGIVLDTPNGNPRHLDFSPTGRYLAFEDQGAIFVLPMDDVNSTPFQIWENSMSLPRWAAHESRLLARHDDGHILYVDVQTNPVFATLGVPRELVEAGDRDTPPHLFDVFTGTPDLTYLSAYLVPNSGVDASADSDQQSVDVHFIINLPAHLAR